MKTVDDGVRHLAEILPRANDMKSVSVPASEIVLGTNCDGSDGQSGITANAALGITSGSTAMYEVYEYAESVTERGMVVMDTPGFDPPSVTGIVAGGANVVVFTTGRGSCFGCKPTPSIKVASNAPMHERMIDDMDIDAGRIVSAGATVE